MAIAARKVESIALVPLKRMTTRSSKRGDKNKTAEPITDAKPSPPLLCLAHRRLRSGLYILLYIDYCPGLLPYPTPMEKNLPLSCHSQLEPYGSANQAHTSMRVGDGRYSFRANQDLNYTDRPLDQLLVLK